MDGGIGGDGNSRTERTPAGWVVARCAAPSCRARIIWALSASGSKAPFDADPDPARGDRELTGLGPTPVASYVAKLDRFGRTDLYLSHWATCPAREAFRKKRSP